MGFVLGLLIGLSSGFFISYFILAKKEGREGINNHLANAEDFSDLRFLLGGKNLRETIRRFLHVILEKTDGTAGWYIRIDKDEIIFEGIRVPEGCFNILHNSWTSYVLKNGIETFILNPERRKSELPLLYLNEPFSSSAPFIAMLKENEGIKTLIAIVGNPEINFNEETLSSMNSIVADAIEVIERSIKALRDEEEACRDHLTGLLNRRSFGKFIENMQTSNPASFIMIDIDYFKNINDSLGHSEGDRVLQKVGGILSKNIRKGDFLFRWGGEEFAVLLPGANLHTAFLCAERMRKGIASTKLVDNGRITISLGVSSIPWPAIHIDNLIEQADRALYVAKEKGRNRVISARELL